MDAFENVVAAILQREGYWTLSSVKVDLTRAEKRKIGRHSSPRWELDVVAYRGRDNELRIVECKSFLDSPGVDARAFVAHSSKATSRYKMFREKTLRQVVVARLRKQLFASGFCGRNPKVKLCLAAGKIRGDASKLHAHFKRNRWLLLGPDYIRDELRKMRDCGYENSVAAVVTKILTRESKRIRSKPGIEAETPSTSSVSRLGVGRD